MCVRSICLAVLESVRNEHKRFSSKFFYWNFFCSFFFSAETETSENFIKQALCVALTPRKLGVPNDNPIMENHIKLLSILTLVGELCNQKMCLHRSVHISLLQRHDWRRSACDCVGIVRQFLSLYFQQILVCFFNRKSCLFPTSFLIIFTLCAEAHKALKRQKMQQFVTQLGVDRTFIFSLSDRGFVVFDLSNYLILHKQYYLLLPLIL